MSGALTGGYHVKTKFKIGGEGGWDYAATDSAARRLYVSHATQVEVLDLDNGSVVGKIPDTPGAHGIVLLVDVQRQPSRLLRAPIAERLDWSVDRGPEDAG